MKIKELIKREAFKEILSTTVGDFYVGITSETSNKISAATFYVFPFLNVICRQNPHKRVKRYIIREYTVDGSFIRNVVARTYISLVLRFPFLFIGIERIALSVGGNGQLDSLLIFPCNKKIRIFDFQKEEIVVLNKLGFPDNSIEAEVKFRTETISDHFPTLVITGTNFYIEKIIKGVPLARINHKSLKYTTLKTRALQVLQDSLLARRDSIEVSEYVTRVRDEMEKVMLETKEKFPFLYKNFTSCFNILYDGLSTVSGAFSIALSHGDFHHGNIWVEEENQQIIIIDWETVAIRSLWYDQFTLFGHLREVGGLELLVDKVKSSDKMSFIEDTEGFSFVEILLVVLLEDLKFRVDDFGALPAAMGAEELNNYCLELNRVLKGVVYETI